ncbi:MAG TPA: DNA/RNA nuclease SfsA [Roseiflexaceae bacterium]|nr:DNA/RNA nuclease SfsA [Roseiflexaceae bacterium]HMP40948.1 DNA/RNA nuclease SfsA [Roseiflexaceae bacterium]
MFTPCIPLGGGGRIHEAIFVARPNRFVVEARLGHELVRAHLADRGRLRETLIPGARILLAERNGAQRATRFQAVAAYVGTRLAGIDTLLPNRLIAAALRAAALPPFAAYPQVRAEVRIGTSRFDFQLGGPAGSMLLEVKSAGLILDRTALFPDAPTTRGARHVRELAEHAAAGTPAAILFVAQGDADTIAMHRAVDPDFADALATAAAGGVAIYGYSCPITPAGITLGPAIPVQFTAEP